MSEIWNLNALCRCCHSGGIFKNMELPYMFQNTVEIYSIMLQEIFGIDMKPPPVDASFSICDECIELLRNASNFKTQILECEEKFKQYCTDEQVLSPGNIKVIIDMHDFDTEIDDGIEHECIEENQATVTNEAVKDQNDMLLVERRPKISKVNQRRKLPVNKRRINTSQKTFTAIGKHDTNIRRKTKLPADKRQTKVGQKSNVVKRENKKNIRLLNEQGPEIDMTLIVPLTTGDTVVYSCKICGGSYTHEKDLKTHIRKIHTSTLYKCEYCHKKCSNKYLYRAHLKKHGEKNYQCHFCNKKYHLEKILLEHLNIHTKQNVFSCNYCNKDFLYKQTLRRHIKLHLGTSKGHMCDICGNSFNDSTHLGIHIKTVHEKIKPYACNICFKQFAANKTLKVHYRKHTGERPYKCDICSEAFISFSHLKRHKELHFPNNTTGKYKCKMCQQSFLDRGSYSSHVRTHIGEKPHRCHICDKDFSCKYSLKRHTNEHYGVKAYSCDICENKFTQKVQLLRHIARIHDPNRPLLEKMKCDLCKKFVTNYERHMETHNKKPHACELCEKRYPERNALNRHIRNIHYGIRPHLCDMCDKKYISSTSLKNHKMRVHKVGLKIENFGDALEEKLLRYEN